MRNSLALCATLTLSMAGLVPNTVGAAFAQSCSSDKDVVKASISGDAKVRDIVDTAVAAGSFKTLAAALTAADLIETLKGKGPFTVLAPTDEAFAKLPKDSLEKLLRPEGRDMLTSILTYHVVSGRLTAKQVMKLSSGTTVNGQRVGFEAMGDKLMVNDATVVKADIECKNGVIHVIDGVLLPSFLDLVDTAVKADQFKTLATALKTAHLLDTLKGEGPFTVFAPTDDAFAKLPHGAVASLLEKKNRKLLTELLTYHVVPGKIFAKDAIAAETAITVQGEAITIRLENGELRVNGARVIKNDIETTNGVIHIIDAVIQPPSKSKS